MRAISAILTTAARAAAMAGRAVARRPLLCLVCAAVALAAAVGDGTRLDGQRTGVPVPLPVYEIEAISGDHEATLLGLPIAPLGVVAVPTPVDVDGDLRFDVTVAVNLVNVAGILGNPPSNEPILAPNVEINRLLPGLPLTAVNPPLRINVKLTVLDVGGTAPPTILRLGYDTGATGGSIPARFKVLASGLQGFFNPVTASVTTPGYEGPLTVVAGIEQGDERADADLQFLPMPGGLEFAYGSDEAGQHLGASHAGAVGTTPADQEVDLDASVRIADGADRTTIAARVDRLPRDVDVTIAPGAEGAGGFDYLAPATGRLPDVRVDVSDIPAEGEPLVARLDVESLPSELHATWSLPDDGPTEVHLDAPQAPIGAVEARVANFVGEPSDLPAYIPAARQFLDLRESAGGEQLVTGRVETIRLVDLVEHERGVDARVEAGGGQPIELHASLGAVGDEARQVDALSTVTPLPTVITAAIRDAGDDPLAEPLEVVYEASSSVDVDGRLEVRDEGVDAAAPCGTAGTICADLTVTDIPARIATEVARIDGDTRVTVDAVPRLGADAPAVEAGLIAVDEVGEALEASVEATELPGHMSVRIAEGDDASLERAEFHACDRDYASGTCAAGTEGSIGTFAVAARNFLDAARPAGLERPVLDRTQHVVVAALGDAEDGTRFEAVGRFTDIEEVQYVADSTTGLRVRAGAGEEFLGEIHLRDIDPDPTLPDPEDSDPDAPEGGPVFDLDAALGVAALPSALDICFRSQGAPLAATSGAITEQCDTPEPFGDAVELEGSPLSFGYRSSELFDVEGSLHQREQGRLSLAEADGPADDAVVDAALGITGLPNDLVMHLLQPAAEGEPDGPSEALRARLAASDSPQEIRFSASQRAGDAACEDARPGADATCVSGTITGFPEAIDLFFDPSATPNGPARLDGADNNLVLTTTGGEDAALTGFRFSSVTPVEDAEPARSDVVIVDGSLTDIPATVVAKLRSPRDEVPGDEADFDLIADPSLGQIDLGYRNFVGPDLFAAVPPAHALPATAFHQHVAVQSQGDDVKARIQSRDVTRVTYRTVRDAQGAPLDTKVVGISFAGGAQSARVFADIQDATAGSPSQLLADLVVTDLPTGLQACVRGERDPDASDPAPGTATWCDGVPDDQGAFRIEADGTGPGTTVDAYVRQQEAGGSDLLAARLEAEELPPVLTALLPGGTDTGFDLRGLGADGTTPEGIGQVGVEVAVTRDLELDGWDNLTRPFARRALPTSANGFTTPFPAPGSTTSQHLSVAKDGDIVHLRGRIGPSSQLQHLRLLNEPCAAPANDPPDYPHFPLDDPEDPADGNPSYRCIAAAFAPGSASADVLALSVAEGSGPGEITRLSEGGLTDIPAWFQLTVADAETTSGADEALRPRCGSAAEAATAPDGCVPAMLRFDQPDDTSELFGRLERGDPLVLFQAGIYEPTCPAGVDPCAPDLDVVPPTGEPGIRVKVLDVKPHPYLPSASALRVGFRLALPQSLTVEHPQTWAHESEAFRDGSPVEKAKDVRFAYAVRDPLGQPVENLGRLSVFVFDGSQELLVADADPTLGVVLPGELGLDLYLRDTKAQGRRFIQIDGRTSSPLTAALTMFDPTVRPPDFADSPYIEAAGLERVSLTVQDAPASLPGDGFDDPSFRIRFEMLKSPEAPGAPPPSGPKSYLQIIGSLVATLDFAPDGTPPDRAARRIEGVLLLDGGRVALELAGFTDVDSPPDHVDNAPGTTRRPAEFGLHGDLDFDELHFHHDDGDNDTHTHIDSALYVDLDVVRAENFRLRNNVAAIDVAVRGPDSSATIGPIIWNIERFYVERDSGYALQAEVTYDGAPDEAVQANFFPCGTDSADPSAGYPDIDEGYTIYNDVFNGAIDILDDGDFDVNLIGVPEGGLADVEKAEAVRGAVCGLDTGDIELIHHDDPFEAVLHPGDPLAAAGHDVPPADLPHIAVPAEGPIRAFGTPTETGPPPSPVIGDNIGLCGLHTFDALTVNAVVSVAGTADPTAVPWGTRPRCPEGSEGRLTIVARTVVVNGWIEADDVITTFPIGRPLPTGNGGGGHGGSGGEGGYDEEDQHAHTGVGAYAFESGPIDQPVSEVGMPGGGMTFHGDTSIGPPGGGLLNVHASERIDVNGAISADGADAPAQCGTIFYGAGGGSGGGIVLVSPTVAVGPAGSIRAAGGKGGDSSSYGGGGGGGGVVKVHSPEFTNPAAVSVAGGGRGGGCPNGGNYFDGRDGHGILDITPYLKPVTADRVTGLAVGDAERPSGWANQGDGLRFGYQVKLPAELPPGGPIVFLCVVPRNEATLGFSMPGYGGAGDEPCGAGLDPRAARNLTEFNMTASPANGIELGETVNFGDEDNPKYLPVDGSPLPNGVWGAWTHVCSVYESNGIFGYSCGTIDPILEEPDVVFGVDARPASIVVDAPGLPERGLFPFPQIVFAQSASDGPVPTDTPVTVDIGVDPPHSSIDAPVERVLCWVGAIGDTIPTDDVGFFNCDLGLVERSFPDGISIFLVRVIDVAGNRSTEILAVTVDGFIPRAQAVVEARDPVGEGGFHRVAPSVLFRVADGPNDNPNPYVEAGLADPAVYYSIDGGEELSLSGCVASTDPTFELDCAIPRTILDDLLPGTHTIRYTGADLVGNRRVVQERAEAALHPEREMLVTTFTIDGEAPGLALDTVPTAPDGAGGWFVTSPHVVVTARDGVAGSGVDETDLTVNGTTAPYTGPVRLAGEGAFALCAEVDDVAGNPAQACGNVQVDVADPVVTIAVPSPSTSGWHLSPPTVTVTATDSASGVAPFSGGTALDCRVEPAPAPDSPSGLCVSIDGAPFVPSAGTHVVPDGVHTVRAFAVDRAGHRSAVRQSVVRVDQAAPQAFARLVPPSPARGQWWRRTPTLVLRATDTVSGVVRIEYRIDGGPFQPYRGPVELPSGTHTVRYRATDAAGRTSVVVTLPFAVDPALPTVQALSATPNPWVPANGPATATLRWSVADNRAGPMRVTVLIYNASGNVIRRLNAGTHNVAASTPLERTTTWDGRNSSGERVSGTFHYRVVAIDDAGNRSQSGESRPLQLVL